MSDNYGIREKSTTSLEKSCLKLLKEQQSTKIVSSPPKTFSRARKLNNKNAYEFIETYFHQMPLASLARDTRYSLTPVCMAPTPKGSFLDLKEQQSYAFLSLGFHCFLSDS